MALRKIVQKGDEILNKRCKEVKEINERVLELLDDMKETMYENGNGVGLAAPQVGILKRLVVIDVGDGLIEMINPVIIESEGEQVEVEGCLSLPGIYGRVRRPARVVVEYLNRNGKKVRTEGLGLLAICICHELDHLDGILFDEKVIEFVEFENEEK
ncbi:MAG: peptide deformylase [Clostridiaceae bacterium]|jgi:peptide deformylase|nr:peptide deformylase [Clostridiaceae bacterium]